MAFGAFAQTPTAPVGGAKLLIAVDWVPLYANSRTLKAFDESFSPKPPPPEGAQYKTEHTSVLGDEQELSKAIASINSRHPEAVLAFGDHVCSRVVSECPGARVLAFFVRDAPHLKALPDVQLTILDSEPVPAMVWSTAKRLKPALRRVGVIYTDEFSPNATAASLLQKEATAHGADVVSIKVNPGFCRTDSDFQAAIKRAHEESPLDLLYVPDDPNCSRFGDTICQSATTLHIPVIGTEAITGKGCVLALEPDYAAIGKAAAEAARKFTSTVRALETVSVTRKTVVDRKAMETAGVTYADNTTPTATAPGK